MSGEVAGDQRLTARQMFIEIGGGQSGAGTYAGARSADHSSPTITPLACRQDPVRAEPAAQTDLSNRQVRGVGASPVVVQRLALGEAPAAEDHHQYDDDQEHFHDFRHIDEWNQVSGSGWSCPLAITLRP